MHDFAIPQLHNELSSSKLEIGSWKLGVICGVVVSSKTRISNVRTLTALAGFVAAMFASLLPHRHWPRLPVSLPVTRAAFLSGIATGLLGAAIGIPAFLDHAAATVSIANQAMVDQAMRDPQAGYSRGMVQGFAGLSIFTFLLTPAGVVTLYLLATGAVRAAGAWFDDPLGDPILTGVDYALLAGGERRRAARERRSREALEGPDVEDRVVSAASAGLSADLVVVAARRKAGWGRGVTVLTAGAAYRIGEPVERTVAGCLRTLYPLTIHADAEAVRKSVRYDLPRKPE